MRSKLKTTYIQDECFSSFKHLGLKKMFSQFPLHSQKSLSDITDVSEPDNQVPW